MVLFREAWSGNPTGQINTSMARIVLAWNSSEFESFGFDIQGLKHLISNFDNESAYLEIK